MKWFPNLRMWKVHCAMIISIVMVLPLGTSVEFGELFKGNWALDHIVTQGDQTTLSLDESTSCGFESQKKYLFGKASAQLILVQGDSAGTVIAFYMSSDELNHDELDFEFIGNTSGEPYIDGTGDCEQRHYTWFDRTTDLHTYFILFLVDDILLREFANKEKKGGLFPKSRAMGIRGSLWNADDWATQGGRVKTNWSNAPFEVTFQAFEIDACELAPDEATNPVANSGKSGQFWWDKPAVKDVSMQRKRKMKWIRDNYLIYDYCKDVARFPQMPKECMVH